MQSTTNCCHLCVSHLKQIVSELKLHFYSISSCIFGARCSSVVRAFGHGAMGRRIDPSWGGPTELLLVPASAPQLV